VQLETGAEPFLRCWRGRDVRYCYAGVKPILVWPKPDKKRKLKSDSGRKSDPVRCKAYAA
jgi:hypothetical protein